MRLFGRVVPVDRFFLVASVVYVVGSMLLVAACSTEQTMYSKNEHTQRQLSMAYTGD